MPAASPSPSRPSAWEWTLTAILAANLVWTTLYLGGFRPETMVITSAANALLMAVYFASRAFAVHGTGWRSHAAGWLLLPFLAYAAANVLWVTPVSWRGWLDWLGWAQMIVVFWVVLNGMRSSANRKALLGTLVLLGVIAIGLACYQRFVKPDWLMMGRIQSSQFLDRSSGPFGIPNSLAAFLLLLLPLLGALACRRGVPATQRVVWGYLTLVFVFGLVLTISRGAWLALAAVLVVWPALAVRGSPARRLLWIASTTLALAAVATALYLASPTVRSRLAALKAESGERTRPIMWRGAWQIFAGHPVCGGGAGSYSVLFEKFRPENYQDEPLWAHNDYLNTLSDYGGIGFLLFFGACGVIVWRCGKARLPPGEGWLGEPLLAQALTAGLAAFALQLFVDFHLKIPALAMSFAVAAALLVQRTWPVPVAAVGRWRAACAVAALAIVAFTAVRVCPFYRGEALRYGARQSIDRIAIRGLAVTQWAEMLIPARASLQRAVGFAPTNGAAWAELAYATELSAHLDPAHIPQLGRDAERAASRALACSKAPPEFWVRHGAALDMQGRWNEAAASFAEALRLGGARAATWYNYAFHLSLNRGDPRAAMKAVEVCLRLDPANQEAQALRQRLATRIRAP